MRDFDTVVALGSDILRQNPDDHEIRRAMARLFAEQGLQENALPHWQHLHSRDARDFEAAFHTARARMQQGRSLRLAVDDVAADCGDAFRKNLSASLEEGDADAVQADGIRHVAICGVSYSGSTLLDRLLGGLPGAASIGESHWLIKSKYEKGYDFTDFGVEPLPPFVPCSVCGKNCAVLTGPFRRGLAANRRNWYFRIARRVGTSLLVSADKNPSKVADNDPLLRCDAVVLFKSPLQAWASELEKRPKGKDDEHYARECEKYLGQWADTYRTYLDHFRPAGEVRFVSFEHFVRDPGAVLRSVCRALSLPFDEAVLSATRPGHAIGGNGRAVRRLRAADYAVEILPLAAPELPGAHLRILETHGDSQQVHADLLSAFDRTMTGADRPVAGTRAKTLA